MPTRLRLLVDVFRLSVSDVAAASGHRISRSQVHRILTGQHRPSSEEKAAVAAGFHAALQSRMDSSYIFDLGDEEAQP